jgi:hypothetical protein
LKESKGEEKRIVEVPKAMVVERIRSKSGPEMATPFNEQWCRSWN